jgi:hypothetical protein
MAYDIVIIMYDEVLYIMCVQEHSSRDWCLFTPIALEEKCLANK